MKPRLTHPSARFAAGVAALACLLAPEFASAFERLDHRDQPSISVTPGYEHLILAARGDKDTRSEPGAFAELAFGLPGGEEGGEGIFGLRLGVGPDEGNRLVAPYVAYRNFAGDEEWKTFFDIGAFSRILPVWGLGVRVGAGVQYDFTQSVGAFLATGGSVAYGEGLQVAYDVGVGLQLRFGSPGGG